MPNSYMPNFGGEPDRALKLLVKTLLILSGIGLIWLILKEKWGRG